MFMLLDMAGVGFSMRRKDKQTLRVRYTLESQSIKRGRRLKDRRLLYVRYPQHAGRTGR